MSSKLVFCLILCLTFSSSAFGKRSGTTLGIRDNSIVVYYAGEPRLTGGAPIFQSRAPDVIRASLRSGQIKFETTSKPISVFFKTDGAIVSLFLSPDGNESDSGKDFLGLFFKSIPGYSEGVSLWRYGPWNSWTTPVKIDSSNQLQDWDIQFFYWKYSDGFYGAAMPLSGEGYRTTLGNDNGHFCSKSVSYFSGMHRENIPQMAIGFGKDPYSLFASLYRFGLQSIGKANDFIANKTYPKVFDGIGWCSWNASVYGTRLNDNLLLRSAKSFHDARFPMRWFLIDDGWFDQTHGMLNSFQPDSEKFPDGFKPVIGELKEKYGIPYVGIWHALDGYWSGINPHSQLGKKFGNDLFSWKVKIHPDLDTSALKTCYFISPGSEGIRVFYDDFEKYLASQGCSFVKVDNQLVTERMAPENFPIFTGAAEIHKALNASVAKYFHDTMINCMDMTPEAYLNFGSTCVGRAEDDYWPEYDTLHPKNYWFKRAGDHILQEVYNSLYFSQMVYPDFDMFESINPAATFYAIAHAINDGPTYITDKVGEHDFNVLWPLICSDGTLLRPNRPAMPTEDCLFNVDADRPFKAFSMDGKTGLLAIWNCTDSNRVSGIFRPTDVNGIEGNEFAAYEFFSKSLKIVGRNEEVPFSLGGYAYKLYYIIPLRDGNGVVGLIDKYNAPAAVAKYSVDSGGIKATIRGAGPFAAVVRSKPKSVRVNGKETTFEYNDPLLEVKVPLTEGQSLATIDIEL